MCQCYECGKEVAEADAYDCWKAVPGREPWNEYDRIHIHLCEECVSEDAK